MYSPRRALLIATTSRLTSLTCPTARVRTSDSSTYSFCWPWYLSTVVTCTVSVCAQPTVLTLLMLRKTSMHSRDTQEL